MCKQSVIDITITIIKHYKVANRESKKRANKCSFFIKFEDFLDRDINLCGKNLLRPNISLKQAQKLQVFYQFQQINLKILVDLFFFFFRRHHSSLLIILIFVDDSILVAASRSLGILDDNFSLKTLGKVHYFLCLEAFLTKNQNLF